MLCNNINIMNDIFNNLFDIHLLLPFSSAILVYSLKKNYIATIFCFKNCHSKISALFKIYLGYYDVLMHYYLF